MTPTAAVAEHIASWDAGECVLTIEMGGIGPGYEQAIQILAIEIMRDNINAPLPKESFGEWGDLTVARIDYRKEDGTYACGGFSGAQVGAAKHIALRFLEFGPEKAMEGLPSGRRIVISKAWPHIEEKGGA